ncbi:hypothetical protein Tco_1158726, partial [Tanacetum coccineum]
MQLNKFSVFSDGDNKPLQTSPGIYYENTFKIKKHIDEAFDVDVVMGSGVTHDNLQEVASSDCMIIHGTKNPHLGSNGVDPQ